MEKDAYFAGLFDGEGHIQIKKLLPNPKHRRLSPLYLLVVTVSMTHEATVVALKEYAGTGSIYGRRAKNPKHRNQWRWETWGQHAKSFLTSIYPYLVTKKGEVEIAFEFLEVTKRTAFGRRVDSKISAKREEIKLRLQTERGR